MLATSYMEITASRDCATLFNIHILPGTVVHIDKWIAVADGTIITFDFSDVSHFVVNQS